MPSEDLLSEITDILVAAFNDNIKQIKRLCKLTMDKKEKREHHSTNILQNKRWILVYNLIRKMHAKRGNIEALHSVWSSWTKHWLKMALVFYENKIADLKRKALTPQNLALITKIEGHIEEERRDCTFSEEFFPEMFHDMMCLCNTTPAEQKYIMDNLKVKIFTQEDEDSNNKDVCSICCEERKVSQEIVELSCGHKLHYKCAKPAIALNPRCCLCRQYFYVDL